jgi:tripartite-type tricarboxylate transporter receptor subunit TctC
VLHLIKMWLECTVEETDDRGRKTRTTEARDKRRGIPITMVVPVAAGSGMDTVARIFAERMRANLGQPVIVENVPGASGSIGIGRVARALSDGYTLSYGAWATHVVNGAVYELPYDLGNDFESISQTINTRFLIAARNGLPASDLKGLVAWLKANPDKASAGTSGAGSPAHIGGVLFQSLTDTRFQFVPYRGTAPAMQDLVAGQIDMMIDNTVNALPLHRAGRIKAYAVLAGRRSLAAPDLPTADEAGVPGFHLESWHGIWAPKGTPKAIIAKLNASVVEALNDPAVRKRVADLGAEIAPPEHQTPGAFGTFHKAEIAKWWPIIKAAGIKMQ